MERQGFVFYQSFLEAIECLPTEQQLKAYQFITNYGLRGIEPSIQDDPVAYAIFLMAKPQIDKNNDRFANGSKGGRPKKNQTETKTKPNENQTQTIQEPKEKEKDKVKDKVKEKENVKDKVKENKELSLLPKSNDFEPKEITTRINDLISELKQTAKGLGIAYDNKDERMFSKHILTAKAFNEFAMNINQEPTQFAINIMKASVMINYWKGPCSGPKLIYQNYAEVFNKTQQQAQKSSKNLIQEF